MPISKLRISKLFGYFDHDITIKEGDRITIIHGVNGVGKTTILRMLKSIFSRRISRLLRTPFSEVYIELKSGDNIKIERSESRIAVRYEIDKRHGDWEFKLVDIPRRRLGYNLLERYIDSIQMIGPNKWIDNSSGDILSFGEVLANYSDLLPDIFFEDAITEMPDDLSRVLTENEIYLIETQRLIAEPKTETETEFRRGRRPEENRRTTVSEYANDLREKIQIRIRESGELSAKLDREFPNRLLEEGLPPEANDAKIRELYEEQKKFRERLMSAGLMDTDIQPSLRIDKLEQFEQKVLWIYLGDIKRKFNEFESLLSRIELLKEIINNRFSFKSLSVDAESGLKIISSHDNSLVDLHALSSGEQHELVLVYDLLFRVKKNSLVLIDEPELSLHVTWQRKFLEDIEKISNLVQVDFLIATHSPSIINDRRDLMVGLGGME